MNEKERKLSEKLRKKREPVNTRFEWIQYRNNLRKTLKPIKPRFSRGQTILTEFEK